MIGMFFFAHLAAGLIIGKLFNSYALAIATSLLLDVDHLYVFIKHRVLFSAQKFWDTITDPIDHLGGQRAILHNYFVWAFLSLLVFLWNRNIGIVFSVSYFAHLFLDLIDGSDFTPFWPFPLNIQGPVTYFSTTEFVFTGFLYLIYFLLFII